MYICELLGSVGGVKGECFFMGAVYELQKECAWMMFVHVFWMYACHDRCMTHAFSSHQARTPESKYTSCGLIDC